MRKGRRDGSDTSTDRHRLDLDLQFGESQPGHAEQRHGRHIRRDELSRRGVRSQEFVDIRRVDVQPNDIRHIIMPAALSKAVQRKDVNPWEWSKAFGFSQAVELTGGERMLI